MKTTMMKRKRKRESLSGMKMERRQKLTSQLKATGKLSGHLSAFSLPLSARTRFDEDGRANAYYFWNQKTNETTWTNPLEPAPTASATTATPSTTVEERPKDYGGIDPELAYLDPMLAYGARTGVTGAQTAKFNARTGRFEGADARTPDYVSEQSRYKRQSAFFFDVDGWEKQNDAEQERKRQLAADGKLPDAKRQKPPTKEELQRYKERAAEKKVRPRRSLLL